MRTGPPGDSHIQQILVWPTFQGSSATVAKVTSHSRSLLSGPLPRNGVERRGDGLGGDTGSAASFSNIQNCCGPLKGPCGPEIQLCTEIRAT